MFSKAPREIHVILSYATGIICSDQYIHRAIESHK
jgi:hypothetical protein